MEQHPGHDDRSVWPQYEDLLERSRQQVRSTCVCVLKSVCTCKLRKLSSNTQFAQLRELPLYGRKQWERAHPFMYLF